MAGPGVSIERRTPLADRVAVVTGATSGLGREIALQLARQGATTVIVGRGEDRVAATAREIAAASGAPRVEGVAVSDLSVRREMGRTVETLLARYPKIHLLVNNAGGVFRQREVTEDGLERTFALNVLAPYFLTSRLFERMHSSAPARVVQVSSEASRQGRIDLADLQAVRRLSSWRVYSNSKLELLLLTREFGRRFAGSGVTVNAVHPGFVRTGFGQNLGRVTGGVIRFFGWLAGRSVGRGAETPVYVASDPSLEGITGEYFSDRKRIPGSDTSRDPEFARRIFEACEALARGDPA